MGEGFGSQTSNLLILIFFFFWSILKKNSKHFETICKYYQKWLKLKFSIAFVKFLLRKSLPAEPRAPNLFRGRYQNLMIIIKLSQNQTFFSFKSQTVIRKIMEDIISKSIFFFCRYPNMLNSCYEIESISLIIPRIGVIIKLFNNN